MSGPIGGGGFFLTHIVYLAYATYTMVSPMTAQCSLSR